MSATVKKGTRIVMVGESGALASWEAIEDTSVQDAHTAVDTLARLVEHHDAGAPVEGESWVMPMTPPEGGAKPLTSRWPWGRRS